MKENYFVYVYLDKFKPGKYCYNNICFLYEPFYIGKGNRYRDKAHLTICKNIKSGTNIFYDKIKKLNFNLIIEKLIINITDETAKKYEIELINSIGKRIDNKGPLTNMTNGGTGGDTFSYLSNDKKIVASKKRSESAKGKSKGLKKKEKIYKFSDEHRKKLSNVHQTKKLNSDNTDFYNTKKVNQYSLDNEFIKTWNSISAAKREGYSKHGIIRVCKKTQQTANGYKWEYKT